MNKELQVKISEEVLALIKILDISLDEATKCLVNAEDEFSALTEEEKTSLNLELSEALGKTNISKNLEILSEIII